jgi:hypothetical protein
MDKSLGSLDIEIGELGQQPELELEFDEILGDPTN